MVGTNVVPVNPISDDPLASAVDALSKEAQPTDDEKESTKESAEEEEHGLRFVLSPGMTPAVWAFLERESGPVVGKVVSPADNSPGSAAAAHAVGTTAVLDSTTMSTILPDNFPVGARVEVCPNALALAEDIGERLALQGGACLFVDYGYNGASADSIRAISNHRLDLHPLLRPGELDLSADVDFAAFARAACSSAHRSVAILKEAGLQDAQHGSADRWCRAYGAVTQGSWLTQMGIGQRLSVLLQNASSEEQQEQLFSEYERLVLEDAEHMGSIYKVLSLVGKPPSMGGGVDGLLDAPPGFAPMEQETGSETTQHECE
jgi:hypothetical protein